MLFLGQYIWMPGYQGASVPINPSPEAVKCIERNTKNCTDLSDGNFLGSWWMGRTDKRGGGGTECSQRDEQLDEQSDSRAASALHSKAFYDLLFFLLKRSYAEDSTKELFGVVLKVTFSDSLETSVGTVWLIPFDLVDSPGP